MRGVRGVEIRQHRVGQRGVRDDHIIVEQGPERRGPPADVGHIALHPGVVDPQEVAHLELPVGHELDAGEDVAEGGLERERKGEGADAEGGEQRRHRDTHLVEDQQHGDQQRQRDERIAEDGHPLPRPMRFWRSRRLASPRSTPTRTAASTSATCRPVVTSGSTAGSGGSTAISTRVAATASTSEGTRWNASAAIQSSHSVSVRSARRRRTRRAARSTASPTAKAAARTTK